MPAAGAPLAGTLRCIGPSAPLYPPEPEAARGAGLSALRRELNAVE
jgi:hypothetical protein